MNLRNFIYGLADPRTGLVRYIGRTTTGMERPRHHWYFYPSKNNHATHKTHWVDELKSLGLRFEIKVLEEVADDDVDSIELLERYWIAQAKEAGWNLTNTTEGGEGAKGRVGFKHDAATRARITESLKKFYAEHPGAGAHSEETKEKIRKRALGRKATPAAIESNRLAQRRRYFERQRPGDSMPPDCVASP